MVVIGAEEYKEWATVSRDICSSFLKKLGVPLSEEEQDLELVTWAAVYPPMTEPVTHYYHAHQESIVSSLAETFIIYVSIHTYSIYIISLLLSCIQ